jgi:hypothetical protein
MTQPRRCRQAHRQKTMNPQDNSGRFAAADAIASKLDEMHNTIREVTPNARAFAGVKSYGPVDCDLSGTEHAEMSVIPGARGLEMRNDSHHECERHRIAD